MIPSGPTATASFSPPDMDVRSCTLCFMSRASTCRLEELERFRQWGSRTPGHPEYGKTPGVEATTGPLGQGLANAVGMAIAEVALAARFNRPGHHDRGPSTPTSWPATATWRKGFLPRLDQTPVTCGWASSSSSMPTTTSRSKAAPSWPLPKTGSARFAAFGWHVQRIEDSNDIDAVAAALEAARQEKDRPSLIQVRTHIGFGSPHKQDTAAAHGEPLGLEEVRLTKEGLGWPVEPPFYIPEDALEHFREAVVRGSAAQAEWELRLETYAEEYPELAAEFERVIASAASRRLGRRPSDIRPGGRPNGNPHRLGKDDRRPGLSSSRNDGRLGRSGSQHPHEHGRRPATSSRRTRAGRNMHFGIREHAIGAILNGMALHRGLIPFGATFLIFSDYMRPPMRLAAMNGLPVIYVFTHDSIAMGEDGPTHQPVEQLLGLRSIPGMVVIRPADANETVAAWRIAIERREGPVALVLTRQGLPVLDLARYPGVPAGVPRRWLCPRGLSDRLRDPTSF